MSVPSLKRYRVTVREWRVHSATVEASDAAAAEAEVRRLREQNPEHGVFCFVESGIDGVTAEESDEAGAS